MPVLKEGKSYGIFVVAVFDGYFIGILIPVIMDALGFLRKREKMSGTICPICGGDMVEDMQIGDMTCDCCGLIIRYDGTADYSLFYELLDSKISERSEK